jgi:hypothetical protein
MPLVGKDGNWLYSMAFLAGNNQACVFKMFWFRLGRQAGFNII